MNDTLGSARQQFGTGPLSRAAAWVYTLLAVELLLLVTTVPGLVLLVLLAHDASNLPLVALCAVPIGPGLSAALYALHHHRADLTDLRPAAAFWRGYRLNAAGALRLWVPWLAAVTVIGINLANLPAAGVPRWWAGPLVLVALAATVWVANALVINSLFAFRARDVARLAGHFLTRSPGVAIGNACLLVVAVGITTSASEAVLALAGSLLALALLRNCRPMVARVRREFTT
jgi:hypothetical protein